MKSYGVSVDSSADIERVLKNSNSEVLEIMFNLFHQETRNAFPLVEEKGVGLIVKVPLDSGWLTGKYGRNSKFEGIRKRWSRSVIERRAELIEKVKEIKGDEGSMVQEALCFILSYPEISTVIPGVRNKEQLRENLGASNKEMPEKKVMRYEEFYRDNIMGNLLPW
ncbi:MAG: aldo/keto reductase [Halanaerobiales bacterium]